MIRLSQLICSTCYFNQRTKQFRILLTLSSTCRAITYLLTYCHEAKTFFSKNFRSIGLTSKQSSTNFFSVILNTKTLYVKCCARKYPCDDMTYYWEGNNANTIMWVPNVANCEQLFKSLKKFMGIHIKFTSTKI